jgi:hypothetical protein
MRDRALSSYISEDVHYWSREDLQLPESLPHSIPSIRGPARWRPESDFESSCGRTFSVSSSTRCPRRLIRSETFRRSTSYASATNWTGRNEITHDEKQALSDLLTSAQASESCSFARMGGSTTSPRAPSRWHSRHWSELRRPAVGAVVGSGPGFVEAKKRCSRAIRIQDQLKSS